MTGRYAVNAGLPFPLLGHPVAGIDLSIPTMAERLRDAGYRTHLVGKWHVGSAQRGMLPTKRGFDSFFGLVGGGFDHYTKEGAGQVDLWRCVCFLSSARGGSSGFQEAYGPTHQRADPTLAMSPPYV